MYHCSISTYLHDCDTYCHTHTQTNRFGLSYNERILIGIVIIASIVFFVVPSILIGVLLRTSYGAVMGMPFPIIVSFIGLYVLWRLNTNRKARKRFNQMTEAARPVTSAHELFRPPGAVGPGAQQATEILTATTPPNDGNLAASPGQSEKEKEKTNKITEVHQTASESEKII